MTIFLPLLLPLVSRAARQLCRCVVAAAAVPNVKPPLTQQLRCTRTRHVSATKAGGDIASLECSRYGLAYTQRDTESHSNRCTRHFEISERGGDGRGGAN